MTGIIKLVFPVIDYSVRALCVKTYDGHPRGCPNFNHKPGCPPTAEYYDDVYEIAFPVYALINKFDFRAHKDKMRSVHPDWSDRQLECCLYWQSTARKQLSGHIKEFLGRDNNHGIFSVETCPEAMGVNVTETLKRVGIQLEWPPESVTYQVALAGIKKARCS